MRRHSTATLMSLTKKELVEYIRMAEHNQDVAEETLKQQAENVKDWIPVVRCAECISYAPCEGGKDFCCFHAIGIVESDYCSYGEREREREREKRTVTYDA